MAKERGWRLCPRDGALTGTARRCDASPLLFTPGSAQPLSQSRRANSSTQCPFKFMFCAGCARPCGDHQRPRPRLRLPAGGSHVALQPDQHKPPIEECYRMYNANANKQVTRKSIDHARWRPLAANGRFPALPLHRPSTVGEDARWGKVTRATGVTHSGPLTSKFSITPTQIGRQLLLQQRRAAATRQQSGRQRQRRRRRRWRWQRQRGGSSAADGGSSGDSPTAITL